MNKLLIALILLVSPTILSAHYPLSARYYLENTDGVGILSVYLSQAGVDRALMANHDREELEGLDHKVFEERIVKYVKENFHLTIEGESVDLLDGGIKYSDHQTDLKFITAPLPSTMDGFEISIPAFQENEGHQTIFSYALNGVSDKVVLSEKNGFVSEVSFTKGSSSNIYNWLIVLIALSIALIVWSRRLLRVRSSGQKSHFPSHVSSTFSPLESNG